MKENPAEKQRDKTFGEGRYTLDGFLGEDPRQLSEIIAEDQAELSRLGVSCESLARAMRKITRAGMAGLGDPVSYDGLEVTVEEWRGWLGCPFQDAKKAAKRITTVKKSGCAEEISWTDLNIHLIEAHCFFQGKGSPRRIEPRDLYNFLSQHCEQDSGQR